MLALITGVGAKGQVGEAVAAGFAKRGDAVLLVSRDPNEVRARAEELTTAGLEATGYACDLTDAQAVANLGRQVRSTHGTRLDALVNLAGGYASTGELAESDAGSTERLFRVNFTTAYLTTREFLPVVADARGSIVYFASERVLEGAKTSGIAAYAAAKSAVVALMRSVADEGRERGFRANALAPTSIRTATNEASMGKDVAYIEREDVAAAVLFLCSGEARAVSGQVIRLRAG
jgi:NAD(P)-dependent dehydrogenase (short-subunit alcohol dehydrogenase family)